MYTQCKFLWYLLVMTSAMIFMLVSNFMKKDGDAFIGFALATFIAATVAAYATYATLNNHLALVTSFAAFATFTAALFTCSSYDTTKYWAASAIFYILAFTSLLV